jgi:hypothetical protein
LLNDLGLDEEKKPEKMEVEKFKKIKKRKQARVLKKGEKKRRIK